MFPWKTRRLRNLGYGFGTGLRAGLPFVENLCRERVGSPGYELGNAGQHGGGWLFEQLFSRECGRARRTLLEIQQLQDAGAVRLSKGLRLCVMEAVGLERLGLRGNCWAFSGRKWRACQPFRQRRCSKSGPLSWPRIRCRSWDRIRRNKGPSCWCPRPSASPRQRRSRHSFD